MKKNLIIWGIALVLVVVAIFITTKYDENSPSTKDAQTSPPASVQNGISNTNASMGNQAIDFSLTDLDGKKVSLRDYSGKNIYLNFFATWCPPCKGEMPDIEKMYQKYKDKNLVVLAIDLGEDRNTVKKFIDKNGYSFKVLLDLDQSVGKQYGTSSIPLSVFIDKTGNVVAKRNGALRGAVMEQYIKMLVDKK